MNAEETRAALERFYEALSRRDGRAMAAMYGEESSFEDPIFRLRGPEIGRMWIGLLDRAKDFSVSYTIAQAGGGRGAIEWTARYLFAGRRPVTNVILSEIQFEGDLILGHVDSFDFPRWAAQALGLPGRLFGRFGWFHASVSRRAARGLGLAREA